MTEMILFWHRRDLRISDNLGLAAARKLSAKIIGVFCFDPLILERDDVAPAQVVYMMGCLQQLQEQYQQLGGQFIFLHNDPTQGIPNLATALEAKAVFWTWDVEPYAQQRDSQVRTILESQGIAVHNGWDQLLHKPGEILTGNGKPYSVYTPFWKNWRKQAKAEPAATLYGLEKLTETEEKLAQEAGSVALPTAKDLGYVWDNPLPLAPGEAAAQNRLEEFCQTTLNEYGEQRNFPALDGTSQLSAALRLGTLGIRKVWQASQEAYNLSRSDETRKNIETWQQELAWREFYQHALYFHPELADRPYRQIFQTFPWSNNEEHFQAWCEGQTGYPIVDAAMRQLNETGWMHNRCRMIVASFLTKDLIINWQWGEKYFMQKLYDGELAANNGGWQWSASCGLDPKPLRIFNPASQAKRFDPEGDYIRLWVPELSSLEPEYLVTGNIPVEVREYYGYPQPIVDHKIQQQKFKQLYGAARGG